jgi:ketosteroid isomerase-like protein
MSRPEATDDAFFAALLSADIDALERLLTPDFLIIDIAAGAVTERGSFIAAVRDQTVQFAEIDVAADRVTRRYGDTGVIVGRTTMRGTIGSVPFEFASRYTHVLVRSSGHWRLASAQGTPITEAP